MAKGLVHNRLACSYLSNHFVEFYKIGDSKLYQVEDQIKVTMKHRHQNIDRVNRKDKVRFQDKNHKLCFLKVKAIPELVKKHYNSTTD